MKNHLAVIFYISILIIVVLFCLAVVFPSYRANQKTQVQLAELEKEIDKANAECIKLKKEIYALKHDPEAIERVAREKYNFSKEGEIIIKYIDKNKKELKSHKESDR